MNPLTLPIQQTFESLLLQENFGGLRVSFTNPSEANLVLNILVQDSIGDYVPADAFYTKRKEGFVNVRGFAPVKRKFAVYIRGYNYLAYE